MRPVTLITDFGTKDQYTALLKGAILSQTTDVQFVDVSHQVDTYDIRQAAYYLKAIYRSFPKGTIHVVAVHNYYRQNYQIICFEHNGQYYIGPNNGVFSLAFDAIEDGDIYSIVLDGEGLDLFKMVAHGVSLIAKGLSITEVGPPLNHYERKLAVQPVTTPDEIRATITHIDKYENVILNVHREFFEHLRKGRDFEIFFKFRNPVRRICKMYCEAPVGEVVCLFNSANYLEIAINMGRASSQLDLMKGETIQIKFLKEMS